MKNLFIRELTKNLSRENILLDSSTGGVVHVDFDCTFVRGLHLLKPEVVPFRLTSNCVSPLGVTGVEGNLRINMELFMQVFFSVAHAN